MWNARRTVSTRTSDTTYQDHIGVSRGTRTPATVPNATTAPVYTKVTEIITAMRVRNLIWHNALEVLPVVVFRNQPPKGCSMSV